MRRRLFALSALCLTVLAVRVCPQELLSKSRANKLLQKTIESQNLLRAGNPAFHLVAHVRYMLEGKTSEGVYEILWTAPNRFRESFQLDAITEVDVAQGDKIYVARNTPTLTPQILHLRNFVHDPILLYLGDRSTTRRIYADVQAGSKVNCITPSENPKDQVCLDAATNMAVSVRLGSGNPARPYELAEDDFVSIGAIRYPRRLVRRTLGQEVKVKVDTLMEAADFAPDVFVPPAKAEARDWCPNPTLKAGQEFHTAPFPKMDPARVFFPFYVLTGPNGHIEKFISLNPSAPPAEGAVAKWIRDAQFPIWVCGSKAIESEVIRMNE